MVRQEIIDKTSKKVKRHGFCNFEYDPETEEKVIKDFVFAPDIDEQDWYWNGSTFQTSPV